MLKQSALRDRLNPKRKGFGNDPFIVVPCPPQLSARTAPPHLGEYELTGAASIDLRLGTWFLVSRQTHVAVLEIEKLSALELRLEKAALALKLTDQLKELKKRLLPRTTDSQIAQRHHVRFGEDFILHPRSFVLGVTLEWLRMPSNLAGYVIGKSSWGRRGLIIATATGVHPGFTGCLTLELSNIGDLPIAIRPGMTIAQLFVHTAIGKRGDKSIDKTAFACKRRPNLGRPKPDRIAELLAGAKNV